MSWEINKNGLMSAKDIPFEEKDWKRIPEKTIESPKGNYSIYCYGTYEGRTLETFTNFMLLKNPAQSQVVAKTDQVGVWYSDVYRGSVTWSGDEKYLFLPIQLRHAGNKRIFEGELFFHLALEKYSFIPVGGIRYYCIQSMPGGKIKIEHEKPVPTNTYYPIVPKSVCTLDRFQWFPLNQFKLIGKLFSQGRFGHFLGNVRDEWNLLIKGSYVPWPYSEMDYYRNKFAAGGQKSARSGRRSIGNKN